MRIFAVDANNDLCIGPDGHMAVNTGLDAFKQACGHAMQAVLGEMVFAQERGLPYEEAIWSGARNLRLFEDESRKTLGKIPGSKGVTEFECGVEENTLQYRAVIRSVYGEVAVGGERTNNG